ncbi:MAG: threonylcarbamoyl-AMP synthase [Nitrospirae bacterium]|nr:threonylcarbamoyl-AMP synthase [Nitrospirota bacterium]
MEKIKITDENAVSRAVEVLRSGGVVMHPTETCYGLAVDVFNENVLQKLYKLKGRDADKPLSILVDGLDMAQEYGVFSEKAGELARKYWPGALSVVVPRKKSLPEFLNKGHDFVSIRNSSDTFSMEMVREFGGPITTTSANKSGGEPLYVAEGLEGVDLIIDGGELLKNKPSTVVKVEGDNVQVLRQGDIDLSEEV